MKKNQIIFLQSLIISLLLCFLCGNTSAETRQYHFKPIDKAFDDIAKRLDQIDFDNKRTIVKPQWLDSLDKIAAQRNNKQLQARALYWRVRMSQMAAPPPECIEMLEKARRLCDKSYEYDLACIEYQLAGNYERMSQYIKTYTLLRKAIKTFENENDYYFLGNAHLLLTQIFMDITNPDQAKEELKLCKEAYLKDNYPLNRVYFFEAMLTNGSKSLSLYQKSIDTGAKDWGMTLQAYVYISDYYLEHSMPDKAMEYCNKAEILLNKADKGNPLFSTIVKIEMVKVLYKQGKYKQVIDELDKLKIINNKIQGERFTLNIYKFYWLANEKLGNHDAAYTYLKLYQSQYEQQENYIKKQDVPKAQAREAIARQNDKISLLEKDAELSRTYLFITTLAFVVIALIAVALFIYFYQRYRIRRIENRELRNSLQQEALIYAVNRKNFEEDIKQKDCEISSSTLLLANKNEVLQQIHDITVQYSDEGRIPKEYVKQVNEVIGISLKNDDEWERFKLHFDSVHPEFFVKLKEVSSDLTENDLRLCAYIRIGMRAKQIAEMLSISPDSVNSNRYRLRKKMQLKRGESLDDFIRKI